MTGYAAMSRLAPDIPELQDVPAAARSLVYMSALNGAIRSPLTWLTGIVLFAVGVWIGTAQGWALFGGLGAMLGAAVAAAVSAWCFFTVILPWRARRLLPSAIAQMDPKILQRVGLADDSLKRMIETYDSREGRR